MNSNLFIGVTPNPNNGSMKVSYRLLEGSGRFEIIDLVGKVVLGHPLQDGENTFDISRSDLPEGIYFYRAFSGNEQFGEGKIVVIR